MPTTPPIPLSNATQALAALSVHASRGLLRWADDDGATVERGRQLISRVTPESMARFIQRPEVVNAGLGAAAVGASMTIPHVIENQVAGTQALRSLGESLMKRHPSIGRILARNPNAGLVAATVAFPYAASPFFEQWFKSMLGHESTGPKAPRDWQVGFMATIANWNHAQPALAAVLKHHPAVLVMAGPLATGLINSGVELIHAVDGHRRRGSASADSSEASSSEQSGSPTAGQTAAGKLIASQTRFFMDTVRQAFKKNAHVPNIAAEFVTSNLYPGWVAALSALYAQDVAGRLRERAGERASERAGERAGERVGARAAVEVVPVRGAPEAVLVESASAAVADSGPVDIEAIMNSSDGRQLLEHLNARPDMFVRGAESPRAERGSRSLSSTDGAGGGSDSETP